MERLIKKGKICAKNSYEIKESRIGIGMEKLDRDSFEPEKAYDKVAALGVKWIRLQSGWQKTEREKGVYDENGNVNVNPDSLKTLTECYLEPALAEAKAFERFQFVRQGFFCVDYKDSKPGALVFNRIVGLKSSFVLPKTAEN